MHFDPPGTTRIESQTFWLQWASAASLKILSASSKLMQRILTAAEMREADRLTIAERGIPGLILMENAAAAVVSLLVQPFLSDREAARGGPLRQGQQRRRRSGRGAAVMGPPASRGIARSPVRRAGFFTRRCRPPIGGCCRPSISRRDVVTDVEQWRAIRGDVLASNVLVDALLGTGLTGPARGLPAAVIADMRAASVRPRIVAVDLPSGTASDNGGVSTVRRCPRTIPSPSPPRDCASLSAGVRAHGALVGSVDRHGAVRRGRIGPARGCC